MTAATMNASAFKSNARAKATGKYFEAYTPKQIRRIAAAAAFTGATVFGGLASYAAYKIGYGSGTVNGIACVQTATADYMEALTRDSSGIARLIYNDEISRCVQKSGMPGLAQFQINH